MKTIYFGLCLLLWPLSVLSQTNFYRISFPNAVHHEAIVEASFPGLASDTLLVRMSRTSPGRYALHEFAKNVYGFEATDSRGRALEVRRPDPYSWLVAGHDGTVKIRYLLYADRGDGTYSQIDETHAHLNIPATFMYAPSLAGRSIEVRFEPREDLRWKVATQLPQVSENTYSAPDLQYFMDSPTELSNFSLREVPITASSRKATIQLVLHHQGTEALADAYFEQLKKVVLEEIEVFGELPAFDFGRYTFLACYLPQVSGDGMEHRNSTVLTSTRALETGGMAGNIGTVSHEFFHAWNVERLRPSSLEPFNFEEANMSGALWFAEGFTSYYTDLILCRAGIISPEAYISGLTGTFNYVWNSPAREFFNPIEMSYQAPFVDAATSIDPVNRENTFISYYSYGSMLGLALDLSLRRQGLTLDGYLKQLWEAYGKAEIPYTIPNLHEGLNRYAGKAFGDNFFSSYIYKSGMPDFDNLFASVGIRLLRDPDRPYLGVTLSPQDDGSILVQGNPVRHGPAYKAGISRGDVWLVMNGVPLNQGPSFQERLQALHPGDSLHLDYSRWGSSRSASLVPDAHPAYMLRLAETLGEAPADSILQARNTWLQPN